MNTATREHIVFNLETTSSNHMLLPTTAFQLLSDEMLGMYTEAISVNSKALWLGMCGATALYQASRRLPLKIYSNLV